MMRERSFNSVHDSAPQRAGWPWLRPARRFGRFSPWLLPPDSSVEHQFISTQSHLAEFCDSIRNAKLVAFDTEFVSEDRYRPELCLLQIAADKQYAVVDTLAFDDLSAFWRLLTEGDCRTVVHAGREEFLFCLRAMNQRPKDWFDVQLAAGMIGLEYPSSYGSLISKLLGESLNKHETRSDWRRRPLSDAQIRYALDDVVYLERMHDLIEKKVKKLNRESWLAEELTSWQDALEASEQQENWRRVSGATGLSSRSLAVVRELWRWRDRTAKEEDRPPRRVLRDDLIVELARRKTSDVKKFRNIRGLEHRGVRKRLDEIGEAIRTALELPAEECPQTPARGKRPQLALIGQFLSTALGSICRDAKLAPSIVGTSQDVRDLIAYRLGLVKSDPPALARGWRAEIVGSVIEDLLDGKLAIVVDDPSAAQPLSFRRLDPQ